MCGFVYAYMKKYNLDGENDKTVKRIEMAKLKVPYTRRSDFSDSK